MKNNALAILFAPIVVFSGGLAMTRDDGRYANSPLKPWFERLKSGRGLCCSGADGVALSDPDWDSQDGHYRVRIDGEWITVPDESRDQGAQSLRTNHGMAHQRRARNVDTLLHAGNHELTQGAVSEVRERISSARSLAAPLGTPVGRDVGSNHCSIP
jgi:hypothetical protein